MKPLYSACLSALALAALPAPALACDLDGAPGFGGFHRMNPFANAYRNYEPENRVPKAREEAAKSAEAGASKGASQDAAPKARRKARKTPVREWERDSGNGPIDADRMRADRATFT